MKAKFRDCVEITGYIINYNAIKTFSKLSEFSIIHLLWLKDLAHYLFVTKHQNRAISIPPRVHLLWEYLESCNVINISF